MKDVDFGSLFESFRTLKVGVVGDVMLDTYWWGQVDRISPEAPVPVVSLEKMEHRIGGAGNVALNLVSLGVQATILSMVGQDADGQLLTGLFDKSGVDTRYLVSSDKRITTNKTRVMARNQQMMRLDAEKIADLNSEEQGLLLASILRYVDTESPAVLILEDYNKGVLTESLIQEVIEYCRKKKVLVTVDPKRKNFFAYQGVDLFKPNLKEVRDALNLLPGPVSLEAMRLVHQQLQERLQHSTSMITLSEKGVFFEGPNQADLIPTHVRNIADVSGAGDTVIAVASIVLAATGDLKLMAEMANVAGGLVCEEVGTVAIDKNRFLKECEELF